MDDTIQKAKSYWSRPEGKTGMLLLAGGAGGLLYGWGKIVPFLVEMVADTFKLGLLSVGLLLFLLVVFSPKTHLIFRLITRKITGLVINLDPIGILKDRVAQMMKRRETFAEKKTEVRGAIRTLDSTIEKNLEEIEQQKKVVVRARQMTTSATSQTDKLRGQTNEQVAKNEVARLESSNKKYANLKTYLVKIQDVLDRVTIYLDGFIADASNEARQKEIERKALKAGHGAVSNVMRILKGSASEQDIYSRTLEHLADEADMRIGAIDDGLQDIEQFMTKIDLQTGFVSDDGMALLQSFESKLALPAKSAVIEMSAVPQQKDNANEYARLIGKKE